MLNLTPYILLLPLAGFVALGLFGRALPRMAISLIGCGVVLAAFALAVADFIAMLGVAPDARFSIVQPWTWVISGSLKIPFGLLSDPLSAVMLLIVTGVGFLIHVYSIGYMADDPGYWRFFSFLNLFIFTMALLVAADNFLMLLVGWGGVAWRRSCSSASGIRAPRRWPPRAKRSWSTSSATSACSSLSS